MDENNDVRIDFRSLADDFSQHEDLLEPQHQLDHPVMNELRDLVYYNTMDDDDKNSFDEHCYYNNVSLPVKDAYEVLSEVKNGKVDKSILEEKFYSGLMEDHRYDQYKEEKQNNPNVTAKLFYDNFVKQYEPNNVKKLEDAFRSLMEEPARKKPDNDNSPHFTREQVEKMSRAEIQKNYDAIKKSEKKWK